MRYLPLLLCATLTLYALDDDHAIKQLSNVTDSRELIKQIPQEYLPGDFESYEKHALMNVLPSALKDKDQMFKDDALKSALYLMYRAYNIGDDRSVRGLIVALIKAGANPNVVTSDNESALHHCIDDLEYTQIVLSHGADANLATKERRETPLFKARTAAIARELVKYHAVIDAITNYDNDTPLHNAVNDIRSEPALLEFLLKQPHINPNARGFLDRTPLESLIRNARYYRNVPHLLQEKMHILLNRGVDHLAALKYSGEKLHDVNRSTKPSEAEKIAYDILVNHAAGIQRYNEEAARLRNICID